MALRLGGSAAGHSRADDQLKPRPRAGRTPGPQDARVGGIGSDSRVRGDAKAR